jgi:hypothetical protein
MKTIRSYLGIAWLLMLLLSSPLLGQGVNVGGSKITVSAGTVVNVAGSITIADSGSIDNNGTISVDGDWTNNSGVVWKPAPGKTEFNGTAPQIITGSTATTFSNLTINNASGVSLKQDVIVDQQLEFKLGAIILEKSTFKLSSPSTQVTGADSTKYIKTLSTGVVNRVFSGLAADTGKAMIFPVGRLQYAPVTLTFHGILKEPSNVLFRVGNSVDAPSGGVDQNKMSSVVWELGAEAQAILVPFEATFDLTSTINTGDIQKYVVMKWDADSLWSRPTSLLMPRPPNYAINLGATVGSFVIGEPSGAGVNNYPDKVKDLVIINSIVPNPGSGLMTCTYILTTSEDARLELFNVLGQSAAIVSDGFQTQGKHETSFNAGTLAEGTYYLRLTTHSGEATAVVKVIH